MPTAPNGETVVAISASGSSGSQALALTDAGTILQWGTSLSQLPTVPSGEQVVQVSAGSTNLAVTDAGTILAWGSDSNHVVSTRPTVPAGEQVVAVAAGSAGFALTDVGAVLEWGTAHPGGDLPVAAGRREGRRDPRATARRPSR